MTYYFDLSELGGAVGILLDPGHQAVFTGAQIHTEPAKYRGIAAAEQFARENDLHFWYDDAPPALSVYTVPQMEIGGYDSRGGLFAGSPYFGFREASSLYYIAPDKSCYLITKDSSLFREMGDSWRERMVRAEELKVFASLEEARAEFPILRPKTMDELLDILKETEK